MITLAIHVLQVTHLPTCPARQLLGPGSEKGAVHRKLPKNSVCIWLLKADTSLASEHTADSQDELQPVPAYE